MRILIVGAGTAGMTLASLLRRWGLEVSIIEQAPNFDHAGYMLGLWPLEYRVLHGLRKRIRRADLIPIHYYPPASSFPSSLSQPLCVTVARCVSEDIAHSKGADNLVDEAMCLREALIMLPMLPLELDEVVAM